MRSGAKARCSFCCLRSGYARPTRGGRCLPCLQDGDCLRSPRRPISYIWASRASASRITTFLLLNTVNSGEKKKFFSSLTQKRKRLHLEERKLAPFECRSSVLSAPRRRQRARPVPLEISRKMSPWPHRQRTVFLTFVFRLLANTLQWRPGTRKSASMKSMSRDKVRERLSSNMKRPCWIAAGLRWVANAYISL